MNRSKFLIGTFGYSDKTLHNEEKFQALLDFGTDYIISANADKDLIALCEKYNIPLIANGRLPGWWGGDGENAGTYHEKVKPEDVCGILKNAIDSPVIAGDYIADEPNSKDFAAINKVMREYNGFYSGKKMPFINLYPNYASVPENTDSETVLQLGNASYLEHLEQYIKEIDCDYICFDFYPFTGRPYFSFIQNMDEAADACRESKRDMWVIIQTGSWTIETQIIEFQIRWQAFLSLAFGAKSIQHACYNNCWWNPLTSCVDLNGHKNLTYYYAQHVNRELHDLGSTFMAYSYIGAYAAGDMGSTDNDMSIQLEAQNARNADRVGFTGIDAVKVDADAGVIVGCFTKNCGCGYAAMVVNCRNPRDIWASTKAMLTVERGQKVNVYIKGIPEKMTADENGKIVISLASGEGVFVTPL